MMKLNRRKLIALIVAFGSLISLADATKGNLASKMNISGCSSDYFMIQMEKFHTMAVNG